MEKSEGFAGMKTAAGVAFSHLASFFPICTEGEEEFWGLECDLWA